MAWDPANKLLSRPFTKIAPNGQGDLQLALGRTNCFSHEQLVCDVDSYGNDVNFVNIRSKYKSFRDSTVEFLDSGDNSTRELALQQVNLGYNIPNYQNLELLFAAAVSAGLGGTLWSWNKPIYPSHPVRANDFDGYKADAEWPFQVGITPNPAYYSDKVANAIEVSDADAATSPTWDETDLKQILQIGNTPICIATDFGNTLFLAVAWAPQGTTVPVGAYTFSSGRYRLTGISATTTYNVVAFFTNIQYNGSYIQTTGIHLPAPLAYTTWDYYNKLPFKDVGSYKVPNELLLHLRLELLESLSYTSLGIEFSNSSMGGNWSSPVRLYSSAGTLSKGSLLSRDNIILPADYPEPALFRIVWNTYSDPQSYSPRTSPIE